jgi:phospholipase/carboxylesterase
MKDPEFLHRFLGAAHGGDDAPTMVLLHGTGGNENDLLEFATHFGDGWNYLSPRGKVLENGMPRFFRRLAEGVFDQEDLRFRTSELAAFIEKASRVYGFDMAKVVALGYSNGANIAASLMLSGTGTVRHAILMHPMVPFYPKQKPDLNKSQILITAGENDPVVSRSNTLDLEKLLAEAGARVELFWHRSGHSLTREELDKAVEFAGNIKKSF